MTKLLVTLFKKIIRYNFKVEQTKKQLYETFAPEIFVDIFELYDEEHEGKILPTKFESFLQDLGFQLTNGQLNLLARYFMRDKSCYRLTDFLSIFFPLTTEHHVIANIVVRYSTTKNINSKEFQLDEENVGLIRQIVIFQLRKLIEMSQVIALLKRHNIDDVYQAMIDKNREMNLRSLSSFLEKNRVSFAEEDLTYVFREVSARS